VPNQLQHEIEHLFNVYKNPKASRSRPTAGVRWQNLSLPTSGETPMIRELPNPEGMNGST
jgi:hypothetical protein